MKILHVGDMAGSAAITANRCNQLGHTSTVIQDESIDTYKHGLYYDNTLYVPKNDMEMAIEAAMDAVGYDHIVYHDQFKLAEKLDSKGIPSSYMFHGNMLRQNQKLYEDVKALNSIKTIFVSTDDLKLFAPDAVVFVRPVDLTMFRNLNYQRKDIGLCLTQDRYKQVILDMQLGNETGIFIVDRIANKIRYEDMPKILNGYTYYYDVKFQPTHPPSLIPSMSQTGLQALACGVAVWSNGVWHYRFPDEHNDETSALLFIKAISP